MKTLVVLSAFLAAACAVNTAHVEEWQKFKQTYEKQYEDDVVESFRMNIFLDNMAKIEKHNARHAKGLVTYTMGINEFSDMLSHEVFEKRNGYKKKSSSSHSQDNLHTPLMTSSDLPDSVDYRDKGYVTPIKDQGQCGSCWSFSSTGSLEGQLFKKTGKLVSLSEQNLVDCSWENDGCDGGDMRLAFNFVKENDGIDTEESYPYEGVDWNGCRYSRKNKGGEATGYKAIPSGDEEALKEALASVGPIAIGMDASHDSFQRYSGGIYEEKACGNTSDDLDHGVLLVGYGTDNGQDYWLLKNSWGTHWGEKGFFKLARNKNNHCGVATEASYPTV